MAELTFKSAGVGTREIDLSGPSVLGPQGVPAGVIGTSQRGPAFVPVTVASFKDFVASFGETDGAKFGPLAMNEWLRNSRSGTYVRILGTGDGLKRTTAAPNAGKVNNAGFVVGARQVQATGLVGHNTYASTGIPGSVGRTYFLGAFMSESAGSTVFSEAGIQHPALTSSIPIVRAVLMAPSGVILALSSTKQTNNTASNVAQNSFVNGNDGGFLIGSVNTSNQNFVLILNGHKNTQQYPNILTASFNPQAQNYFANVLNTDPTKVEQAGHYLYAGYNVYTSHAAVTGSGLVISAATSSLEDCGFIVTGSQAANTGSTTVPNYEGFEDRYGAAFTPYVISQKFGGKNVDLFKFVSLDDGAFGNTLFKISIENIVASPNVNNKFGTFTVVVRDFNDTDNDPRVLERFVNLDINPSSDRYIARVIGDRNIYYDFDKNVGAQKIVVKGIHPNKSQYVRVVMNSAVDDGLVNQTSLPVGFRGHWHLVTSGSSALAAPTVANVMATSDACNRAIQPPVAFRENLAVGTSPKKSVNSNLYWGVQFEVKDSQAEPNKNAKIDSTIANFTKYFSTYHTAVQNTLVGDNTGFVDSAGTVYDADRFNNNMFTLENVQVVTASGNTPDPAHWAAAKYQRNAVSASSLTLADGTTSAKVRFLNPATDFSVASARPFLKFTLFAQGGFDGVNVFDAEKSALTNTAVKREFDDANQSNVTGPTVQAYRKAIDVMAEKSNTDIKLLAIPGARHSSVTDYAVDAVENRFDALYLMDVEERDTVNAVVTSSLTQQSSVPYTISSFNTRNLNSSFAAAYFPDVIIRDPITKTNVKSPPSVSVIGAFALNDALAHPWFAPAGFARGALSSAIETGVKLTRANLDALYDAKINPITSFADTQGVVVFGQKTLLATQSALDRVNVRRLLIDIRRKVKDIANSFIFEPNRADTLARFSASVDPVLQTIQKQQGLERYRVQIDTSTTTQADVENNVVRGKIFIQPTHTVEFVSLDFVVSNDGASV